eukprot:1319015-Pyramimonas_sp.AAC.1
MSKHVIDVGLHLLGARAILGAAAKRGVTACTTERAIQVTPKFLATTSSHRARSRVSTVRRSPRP